MNDSTPRCSIIIVTYNSAHVVGQCLEALRTDDAGLQVIVVDNASSDDTVSYVRQEFPSIELVEAGDNLGFARGVNLGVSHATGDVLCLLNPDAVASRAQIREMLTVFAGEPSTGAAGPAITHPDGRLKIVPMGAQPTLWRMFTHYSGLSRLAARFPIFEGHYIIASALTQQRDVGWIGGGCLFVKRAVWDQVGGLSERWFMYAEDVELCHRITEAGHRLVAVPEVEVEHRVGTSSKGVTSTSSIWITNLLDYYSADLARSPLSVLAWKAVVTLGLWSRAALSGVRYLTSRQSIWKSQARAFRKYGIDVAMWKRPISIKETSSHG